MKYLFLFDVDGTLVNGFNAHHKAFITAFREIFQVDTIVDMYQYHGSTDLYIIYDILSQFNIPIEKINEKIEEIKNAMINSYKNEVKSDKIELLSGAMESLFYIRDKNEGLGLVTGNLKAIANAKLNQVKISEFFPIGGFGDTSKIREDLVRKAILEANKYYRITFDNSNIFIIGDTPRDIIAAHKANVRAIGIATGKYEKKDLIKENPLYIFKNLKEFNELLKEELLV
ncbi:MAG: HAD family hydrolase [Promethearchaeota archaeon]